MKTVCAVLFEFRMWFFFGQLRTTRTIGKVGVWRERNREKNWVSCSLNTQQTRTLWAYIHKFCTRSEADNEMYECSAVAGEWCAWISTEEGHTYIFCQYWFNTLEMKRLCLSSLDIKIFDIYDYRFDEKNYANIFVYITSALAVLT